MSDDFISDSPRAHPMGRAALFLAVLCVAVVAELGPWPAAALAFKPDFPALALVYWGIHSPRVAGFFAAFAAGLLMDLARQTPLGLTPLSYAVMMLAVEWLRGRFTLLGSFGRGFHVFLILSAGQVTAFLLALIHNPDISLSWRHFLPSVSGGILWLAASRFSPRTRNRDIGP